MPSTTEKQARFMAFCSHVKNPPEACPPKKVAKEFNKADKGKTLKSFKESIVEMKEAHLDQAHKIANTHNVPVSQILDQVKKGIKVEHEHTDSRAEATKIAFDHLKEMPNYYTKLDKMEKGKC